MELSDMHVAIIMDGNGRWATARGMQRLVGHARGAERVRDIVEAAVDHGLGYLTLFAFSTENWKRSEAEVKGRSVHVQTRQKDRGVDHGD